MDHVGQMDTLFLMLFFFWFLYLVLVVLIIKNMMSDGIKEQRLQCSLPLLAQDWSARLHNYPSHVLSLGHFFCSIVLYLFPLSCGDPSSSRPTLYSLAGYTLFSRKGALPEESGEDS